MVEVEEDAVGWVDNEVELSSILPLVSSSRVSFLRSSERAEDLLRLWLREGIVRFTLDLKRGEAVLTTGSREVAAWQYKEEGRDVRGI